MKGAHADVPHEENRIGRQVSAPSRNVGADHRDERLAGLLVLKEVRGCKLRVVRNRIGPADLEFDPELPRPIPSLQDNVRLWRVAEQGIRD